MHIICFQKAAVLALAFFVLFSTAIKSEAQTSITNASYNPATSPGLPNADVLELIFDAKADSANIDKIYLLDVKTGRIKEVSFRIIGGIIRIENALQSFNFSTSPVTLPELFVRNPKFLLENPVSITVLLKPKDDKTPPVVLSAVIEARITSLRAQEVKNDAPKGRDDAEIYLSGESITAIDSKPVFSADVKYDKQRSLGLSPISYGPLFSYKGSTNPKADPDQLRAAIKFSGFLWRSKKATGSAAGNLQQNNNRLEDKPCLLCFLQWEATAEIEANRKFTVKNLITNDRLYFNFRTFVLSPNKNRPVRDSALMRFVPFIGAELGKNLSSPIERDERRIARLVAGTTLNFKFPPAILKTVGIKNGIVWENSFTQRWFLTPEIAYDKDTNGKLVLANFGRRPRPHLSSKFNFLINDFFGPTLGYEWGDQPPLYNRVKHQVKFGFTFAQKTKSPD